MGTPPKNTNCWGFPSASRSLGVGFLAAEWAHGGAQRRDGVAGVGPSACQRACVGLGLKVLA